MKPTPPSYRLLQVYTVAISTGLSQPSGNVPLWILMYFQGTGYVEKATPTRFILPQKVLGSTGIIGLCVIYITDII